MTVVVAIIISCIQRVLLRKLFPTIFERTVSAIPFFQNQAQFCSITLLKKKKKNHIFTVVIWNFSLVLNLFWCEFNRKNKLISENLTFYLSSESIAVHCSVLAAFPGEFLKFSFLPLKSFCSNINYFFIQRC